jgi:hypothetical protein
LLAAALRHVLQGGFDGRQDDVEAQENQIDSGQRDDYVAAQNHTLIQHVVQNVEQRHLIARIVSGENDGICRRAHFDLTLFSGRDTNE